MRLIDRPETAEPQAREMTRFEYLRHRLKVWLVRLRWKLPYLVWHNEEIDVQVTFSADRLDQSDPWRSLYNGAISDARRCLSDAGIGFDTGLGLEGRDWEWDFSLKGPISVKFKGRAERPERRRERPKPTLVKSA